MIPIDKLNVPAFIAGEDGFPIRSNRFLKRKVLNAVDVGNCLTRCRLRGVSRPVLFAKWEDSRVAFRCLQGGALPITSAAFSLLAALASSPSPPLLFVTGRETLRPLFREALFYGYPFVGREVLGSDTMTGLLLSTVNAFAFPSLPDQGAAHSIDLSDHVCTVDDFDVLTYLLASLLLAVSFSEPSSVHTVIGFEEENLTLNADFQPVQIGEENAAFLRSFEGMLSPFCRGTEWHRENGRIFCSFRGFRSDVLLPVLSLPTHAAVYSMIRTNAVILFDVLSSLDPTAFRT